MNETEIIKRIQNGDIEALGSLFEIYKNQALKTVYLLTRNIYMSEDIVQEAFVKCFYSIKGLKDPNCFKSWFFRLLTRMTWKSLEKNKKSVPVEDIYEKADMQSFDESINKFISNEENSALREEIEKLEIKQKTVLILYYFNGLSIKEISKVMGCFEGTVKSRLHSARKNLKKRLIEIDDVKKECEHNEIFKIV